VVGKTPMKPSSGNSRDMGFDHVFFPGDDLEEFARRLLHELQTEGKETAKMKSFRRKSVKYSTSNDLYSRSELQFRNAS